MQPHPVVSDLRAVVGDGGVLCDPNELRVYECDGFPVAKGLPTAVVFPLNTGQVAAVVRTINKHGLPIVPRGSGTGLAGGCVVFGQGVIISTSRMTQIESIDLANRVAVVQAGVRNVALSEAVAAAGGSGLHFSPDPSSQKASTIAGNAATNAGGINTLKHGVTTNHVLGIEVVLPDGEVVQSRTQGLYDGMGPDLPGLICGSEGTLGIITRVWCRLVPKPNHFRTIYAVFDSTFNCCKTVADVIAAGIVPTSMEVMDGAMIRVVEDAFHYGFPTTAQALLLLEIDGIDEVLDEQLESVIEICKANQGSDVKKCSDPQRRAELWSARKRAFGAIGRISHSYCTQDACVPRSKLPEAQENINKIGAKYGLKITNVFHAGDGNVHPILLFDEDKPEEVQRVLQASQELLEYCISIGGALTGEHGVGVEKLHLMPKMFNPATVETFLKIKKTFDPGQTTNDGKLIPSDKLVIELLQPAAMNIPGGAS
jgi:glycolate oxidase